MSNHVESILIIGIGMIGASIGLAAKQKGLKVYGFDLYAVSYTHLTLPTRRGV